MRRLLSPEDVLLCNRPVITYHHGRYPLVLNLVYEESKPGWPSLTGLQRPLIIVY